MGTVHTAMPPQTLYVTIRRDELRQLKDERDQLKHELAQLRALTQGSQPQPFRVRLCSAHPTPDPRLLRERPSSFPTRCTSDRLIHTNSGA